tara:strand:+ start:595 stop:795 length:201 start_codon:yes stop_codon:yes gene_type:complete
MNRKLADNYKEGYDAFSRVVIRKGKYHHVVANPMKKNTTPYKEWQRGWEAAYFKNLEKLNGLGKRS